MNKNANYIRNRLSLRKPQEISLDILSQIAEALTLKKNVSLPEELEKVNRLFQTCTDFERTFPSVCFALATGVGKTRLMGAFITYLFLEKRIKNFFVLAPNLTVYNKLIEDFSNTSSPKYVFKGIGEFVHAQPQMVTGDNYDQLSQTKLWESEIHINVFNISKINAETRGGNIPRIKRLSEYLGESYFNYLSNLEDLVLLMDESHHYRADRGMEVLNELNPILGLEVTATPQVERGNRATKFKNVVYEYSLAKAIQDGFVKEPAVATRQNFDPTQYSVEDLDRLKLEDGLRIHEDTKVHLDIYARDYKTNIVKPFVLVVAKDTEHASKLKNLIQSNSFFNGDYIGKVMEIHSNQSGEEKDENIQLLLSLEKPENKIEIVIHVNMLKEGWDVTNLFTIIPLRTAAALTLREQTIGRGLRLPYGKKTGVAKVDKLTIVAHDRFQEIVDEANKPDSIIKLQNIITIDEEELSKPKEVITSTSVLQQKFVEEQQRIDKISDIEQKEKEVNKLEADKTLLEVFNNFGQDRNVKSVNDLSQSEIKELVITKAKEVIYKDPQQQLFVADRIREVEERYDVVRENFQNNIIAIPRISIQPKTEVKAGFKDFDLDTTWLNLRPSDEKIVIKYLREGTIEIIDANQQKVLYDSIENIIVNELMNYPEIDYDSQSELLFKLTGQAINKFKSYLNDENDIVRVVNQNKLVVADFIFKQMMEHFYYESTEYEEPIVDVKAYTKIENHNYSKYTADQIHHYLDTIAPTSLIPTKIFTGFRKSYHDKYKFDSKAEKDFSVILEQDNDVIKWLRPALNQFIIYWDRQRSKRYIPDFIVETSDAIYMVEIKMSGDINDTEVQEKAIAAKKYCKYASEYNAKNSGKPWMYSLIPHNTVLLNMSFKKYRNEIF
jgi:type III restriction enzyme